MKSSPDLGMSFLSTTGCPPKIHGQVYDIEGALPTKNLLLSSASTRVKSTATAVTDLQHPLKGIQGGHQE